MDEERRGGLIQAELLGGYYWLVGFVARLGNPVAGTHADRKNTGVDHDCKFLMGIVIISEVIQSKGKGILEIF